MRAGKPLQLFDVLGRPYETRREKAALLRYISPVIIIGVIAIIILVGVVYLKYKPSDQVTARVQPQEPLAPEETVKPSESVPTLPKVEPIPRVKPIPRKAKPPVTKKDVPIKPKEIIPDKPIEPAPIQPKEKLADVLIRKYPVTKETHPELERSPTTFFIQEWLNAIKEMNDEPMVPHDLETAMKFRPNVRMKRPISGGALAAEGLFTLRCLESEGYIRITETPLRVQAASDRIIYNVAIEFLPGKLNEFKEGL